MRKNFQELFKRPGFADKCELYKKHPRDPNLLGDVYDERVWKISRMEKESLSLTPLTLLDVC